MSSNKMLNNKRERDTVERNVNKRDPNKFLDQILSKAEKNLSKLVQEESVLPIKKRETQNTKIPQEDRVISQEQDKSSDLHNNILPTQPQMKYTLQININKEKKQRIKEFERIQKLDKSHLAMSDKSFFDPSLERIKKRRDKIKHNAFHFIEKGTFEKNLEELKKKEAAKNLGIDLNKDKLTKEEEKELLNLDLLKIRSSTGRQPLKLRASDFIPDVEPWDAYFLSPGRKSFSPYWTKDDEGNWIHSLPNEIKFEDFNVHEEDLNKDKITLYVQHPVPIKNEFIERNNKVNLPVFLTETEKKKNRRLKRLEKEKEKQEKIKFGLLKPDPPKLKFSNFMRILKEEAIQDPTQVEAKVRKAYRERYEKMVKDNEARKLTKEQRSDKLKRKFEKDSKKECKGCLFRIEDLTSNKNRFKIDKNSQQLYLTGLCIMRKKKKGEHFPNFVYVEGGPMAVNRMKNLLLRRIKWNQSDTNNEDEDVDMKEATNEGCTLLWEGNVKKRSFDNWKMLELKTENDAKAILSEKGIEHFWNLLTSSETNNLI